MMLVENSLDSLIMLSAITCDFVQDMHVNEA